MRLSQPAPFLRGSLRFHQETVSAASGSRPRHLGSLALRLALRLAAIYSLLTSYSWAQTTSARLAPEFRTSSRSLITDRVDRTRMLPLLGARHPAAALAQDLGEVDAATPMEHIQLALRRTPERQAAFDFLVQALQDPSSASFHHWLTPEQIGAEFGPSTSDVSAITNYLQSEGFTVNRVGQSQMWIDFTGSAAGVARSFHTSVHRFRAATGEVYTSAVQGAELPAALLPALSGLVSLSNFPFHPQRRRLSEYAVGSGQSVGAQDFYTIYNELPLLAAATPINGAGQTIALLEQTDINPADVTSFRTLFGVSPPTPALTVQHGSASVACADPGIVSTDEESEAVLDTEWAGAVAPGATLLFMSCASTQSTEGILLSAESVIDDNLAGTISLSYGGTELGQASVGSFISSLYQQAAAQGQTVIVSSGDSGSDLDSDGLAIARHGLNVNVLGASAYNISAGGTDFQDQYNQLIDGGTSYGVSNFWNAGNGPGQLTARSYIPETTWNNTCASGLLNAAKEGRGAGPLALCEDASRNASYLAPVGGSGGQSILNSRPSWQTSTVFGLPPTSVYTGRLLPDLSLFAANGLWGHAIYFFQSDIDSSPLGAGGTSFVAPQLAGVFALIAQKTGARVGLANVELYALAGQQFGTSTFNGSACNGSGASGSGETSSLPSASCLFYDIQTGNNAVACRSGSPDCLSDAGQTHGLLATSTGLPAFATGQGYDLATGIGSLNIANFVNSWSAGLAPSLTTLSLSQTVFPLNTSVAFTANVTPVSGNGAPTGTVELLIGSTPVIGATSALSNGVTSGLTSNLPGGTYTVTANYLGDTHFAGSVSPSISVTVTPQATATTLTVSPASGSVYGSTATLTAAVSPTSEGIFVASNSVRYFDGATVLCNAVAFAPSAGVAPCATPALEVGSHSFTATYGGDANFASSASAAKAITVVQATPSFVVGPVTIRYGAASAPLGASLSFGAGLPPSGIVTFVVDAGQSVAGTCAGSASPLVCTVNYPAGALPAGAHTFTANLASDANYTATSATASLFVSGATPAISFAVPAKTYGVAPFTIAANSTSSGVFTYAVAGGPATVSGSAVTLTGIGTVVLEASQAASGNYAASTQKTSFNVTAAGAVWLGNSNGTLSAFSLTGTSLSPSNGFSGLGMVPAPLSMAFDASGNLWIASGSGGVSEFSDAGLPLVANPYGAGGISHPEALAVDGAGQIWIANGNGSISLLSSSGTALSPSTVLSGAGPSTPGGIAIDLSGNVWVTNLSDNSVTEILGVAAPVAPLATALANGITGARP